MSFLSFPALLKKADRSLLLVTFCVLSLSLKITPPCTEAWKCQGSSLQFKSLNAEPRVTVGQSKGQWHDDGCWILFIRPLELHILSLSRLLLCLISGSSELEVYLCLSKNNNFRVHQNPNQVFAISQMSNMLFAEKAMHEGVSDSVCSYEKLGCNYGISNLAW